MPDSKQMQCKYSVPDHVFDTIISLGRTEDIKFSPSNRRLGLAAFHKNKIVIFELSLRLASQQKSITVTDATEFSSTSFNSPHGLDFVDERTIIVANRDGDACIFRLPSSRDWRPCELEPIGIIPGGEILDSPGSVCVFQRDENRYETLICNNYRNDVTRHLLDLKHGFVLKTNEVLLRTGLSLPDGICISKDRRWIAVSNHETQCVSIYNNTPALNAFSEPVGKLLGVNYPHGVRFSSDGNFMVVADAGSPLVHLYARGGATWRGCREPLTSVSVMSEQVFLHGRHNPQEGGPKGVDIDEGMNVLVTTCESQPLAFFEVPKKFSLPKV